jgi:hypothetical protein
MHPETLFAGHWLGKPIIEVPVIGSSRVLSNEELTGSPGPE